VNQRCDELDRENAALHDKLASIEQRIAKMESRRG
jgi:hypothetical protein